MIPQYKAGIKRGGPDINWEIHSYHPNAGAWKKRDPKKEGKALGMFHPDIYPRKGDKKEEKDGKEAEGEEKGS